MSQLIKRPDYIKYQIYGPRGHNENQWNDDIHQLEEEVALAQWHIPHAFIWREGPWKLHLKILAIPILILVPLFFGGLYQGALIDGFYGALLGGFNTAFNVIASVIFIIFGFIYYISRSQYYSIAYKITKSGLLTDNLKLYPRFRYGDQDTTKVMEVLRVIAVILVIVALAVDPIYLAGAGGAVFLSFMKPQQEDGEASVYRSTFWNEDNTVEQIIEVNIYRNRQMIDLTCKSSLAGGQIHCTKENFERVLAILKGRLPDAKFMEAK
jgi:hypothetical protein